MDFKINQDKNCTEIWTPAMVYVEHQQIRIHEIEQLGTKDVNWSRSEHLIKEFISIHSVRLNHQEYTNLIINMTLHSST